MKATELRIGNLVNEAVRTKISRKIATYEITKIRALDIHHLEVFPISKNFEPIPLTEEWLLKFGFVSEGEGNEAWLDIDNKITPENKIQLRTWVNFECFKDYGGTAFFMLENYEGEYYTTIIPCKYKYVHQLQNLYFALTNEELTLIK